MESKGPFARDREFTGFTVNADSEFTGFTVNADSETELKCVGNIWSRSRNLHGTWYNSLRLLNTFRLSV